jgi:hypothetical protein
MAGIDPWYATVLSEVRALEGDKTLPWVAQTSDAAEDSTLDGFRLALGRAYLAQLEKAVNGHPAAKPADLLNAVLFAWNEQHSEADWVSISGDNVPETVPPMTGSQSVPRSMLGVYEATFLEMLIRGDVTGDRLDPITVNLGAPARTGQISHVLNPHLGGGAFGTSWQQNLFQNFSFSPSGSLPATVLSLPGVGLQVKDAPLFRIAALNLTITRKHGFVAAALAAAGVAAKRFLF